jgi:hypothetical protein
MTPEARARGGQVGSKRGPYRPRGDVGAYRREGGCVALWVEVLILALKDWIDSETRVRCVKRNGVTYVYPGTKGNTLHWSWFYTPWCREIAIMAGPAGMQAVRYYFTVRGHRTEEQKAKVMQMIGIIEMYV